MGKYLMAIDAGTGSVRAVLFNLQGEQISEGQREWFHKEILAILAVWILTGTITGNLPVTV